MPDGFALILVFFYLSLLMEVYYQLFNFLEVSTHKLVRYTAGKYITFNWFRLSKDDDKVSPEIFFFGVLIWWEVKNSHGWEDS